MSEFTKSKTNVFISEKIKNQRKEYRKNGIPTILDDSLNLLLLQVAVKNPCKILEIGTATGMSGICMLENCDGHLTTIERDENCYQTAKLNFADSNLIDRVNCLFGDAGDVINFLDCTFDFIFLDGPKARYIDYLPVLKRLLNKNGVLFADNVLFRGLVECEKPPRRDMTIVRNLRAFIDQMTNDENYITSLLDVGDGVLIAYKK